MKKIALLILITILTIVFLETFLRLISDERIFGAQHFSADSYISDPIVNHRLKPNSLYVDNTTRVRPFSFYTNSQSWVGKRDIRTKKAPNTFRIFYIGDSTTMGLVSEKYKMPSIVSEELNRLLSLTGKRAEVINAGTGGWGTEMYYLEIKNKILKYSPDIVVIDFDMTDVRDDDIYKRYTTLDKKGLPAAIQHRKEADRQTYVITPGGLVKRSKMQIMEKQPYTFATYSALYYYFNISVETLREFVRRRILHKPKIDKFPEIEDASWLSFKYSDKTEKDTSYSMFVLQNIIKLLKSHHVTVVVTSVPHYPQYTHLWSDKPHRIVEEVARKSGASYLNSYESLKKIIVGSDQSVYYWAEDPTHFNEKGNKIWAQVQANFLLNELFIK